MKIIKSILYWLLNNLVSIILLLLIAMNAFLFFGIMFHLQTYFQTYFFQYLIIDVSKMYHNCYFQFIDVGTSLGVMLGIFILHLRNMEMKSQTKVQYETFNGNSQFQNFLEATKMLTDKDATNEAKISALYLLYDVAKSHPENLDRIIQVINKQLVPLMLCINDDCKQNKYERILSNEKTTKYLNKYYNNKIFKYTKNTIINIDIQDKNNNGSTISKWQYNGNETEKIIATALYILKRISVTIIQNNNAHIELSNTILFDIDTDFDKDLKFISKEKPTKNLIFLNCKLNNVNFKATNYHICQFIHCDLENSNFTNANLWGSSFIECNLKDTKFNNSECEGVEFRKCFKLEKKQIESITFQNKTQETIKYLIIISEDEGANLELENGSYFKTLEEYDNWKNHD